MIKKFFKDLRRPHQFHISLTILVPFIIMGFAVLASVVTSNLIQFYSVTGSRSPVLWATILIGLLAYISGMLLIRLILKPVEQFVESARKNGLKF